MSDVRVGVAGRDCVVIVSTPLTIIDSHTLLPLLGIHRTVLALWLAVLHEDVGVEEVAQHAAVEMLDVPLSLSLTCSSATGGIKWLTIVEEFVAHILNSN
jgi:hypothetical protein